VRFKVLVLNGDDGLTKNGRESVVVYDDSMLKREGSEDVAIPIVEIGCCRRPEMLQLVDLGQIGGVDDGQAGQRSGDRRKKHKNSERSTTRDLATAKPGNRGIDMRTRPVQAA
jgi:hypothetical protein